LQSILGRLGQSADLPSLIVRYVTPHVTQRAPDRQQHAAFAGPLSCVWFTHPASCMSAVHGRVSSKLSHAVAALVLFVCELVEGPVCPGLLPELRFLVWSKLDRRAQFRGACCACSRADTSAWPLSLCRADTALGHPFLGRARPGAFSHSLVLERTVSRLRVVDRARLQSDPAFRRLEGSRSIIPAGAVLGCSPLKFWFNRRPGSHVRQL
jgi:hypothetical protein